MTAWHGRKAGILAPRVPDRFKVEVASSHARVAPKDKRGAANLAARSPVAVEIKFAFF